MKVAIIGSRNWIIEKLEPYLPDGTTEIVSGGARGIDRCAAECARMHGWKLTEFLPDYARYGRGAPLVRNRRIAEYADTVIAFWDGFSRGTKYTIDYCIKIGRSVKIIQKETDPVKD